MAARMNWRDVLAPELVAQIDDEINRQFAEGWAACQHAVANLTPERADRTRGTSVQTEVRAYPSSRAPRGFWARLLESEVQERFPAELPLPEAMESVQARTDQYELARSSLNAAIQTLEREGRLRRDGHKGKRLLWIPTGSRETSRAPSEKQEADLDEEWSASAISPFLRRLDDAAA